MYLAEIDKVPPLPAMWGIWSGFHLISFEYPDSKNGLVYL